MSDEMPNEIEARIGSLHLKVQMETPEETSEIFDEKLDRLLEEGSEMSGALRNGSRGHQ